MGPADDLERSCVVGGTILIGREPEEIVSVTQDDVGSMARTVYHVPHSFGKGDELTYSGSGILITLLLPHTQSSMSAMQDTDDPHLWTNRTHRDKSQHKYNAKVRMILILVMALAQTTIMKPT